MLACIFLPLLLAFFNFSNAAVIQNLRGSWDVTDDSGAYNFKGSVPGGIYSDLMKHKIIDNVFYGDNDVKTRWVSKKNWTYSKVVGIEQDFYNMEVINLVFDGIDTFAEVYVNDFIVGKTDNMFVQYVFNVKNYLHVGDNTLTVKFQSPVKKADLLYKQQAANYDVPPKCVPSNYNGECHVNFIRKMQSSFSWDWGPALPSVGIWKPAYLEAYIHSSIRYVTVETKEKYDSWKVKVNVTMLAPPVIDVISGIMSLEITTDMASIQKQIAVRIYHEKINGYLFTKSLYIPKADVRRWGPNGYGSPELYRMVIKYNNMHGDVSTKSLKIGFRTIRLVEDEEEHGRSFYFMVNDMPVFAKGSNSIPINVLPERGQEPATVKFLLESAKAVNMNMIRVWGGGVYESDLFYELADELGIMIWQDFMFTCAMYPTNEDFLQSVKKEVRHQVKRLQYHPSIVLWSGNNENEAALRQNWYGTGTNYSIYHQDYVTLYANTIRAEVLNNDPTRSFLTSSPTNGIESDKADYVAFNPQDNIYGDVHFYDYSSNPWSQDNFPTPRFSSEYGLQSLPSVRSWLTATDNISDLAYDSSFMNHRQHHPSGNEQIRDLISYQFDLPNLDSDTAYKPFIYYSQIIQAMAIKQQTEFYRLWRNRTDSRGQGLTMGALYWQLNDVWVAPTWSGIDFNKNWKMLHYFARHFFSDVIIATHLTASGKMDVYIVSDLRMTFYENALIISVYNWQSITPIHQESINTTIPSGASTLVYSTSLDEYLRATGCNAYDCFIHFSVMRIKPNEPLSFIPDNFVFPSPLKSSNIRSASVQVTNIKQIDKAGKKFNVTVQAEGIALFVWLETGHILGTFSDNGFLQIVETKTLNFISQSRTTEEQLTEAISVTHLKDPEYQNSF